ncbi:MAG: hypothetical protein ABI619_11080 [Betaproteobacteria bacterium]
MQPDAVAHPGHRHLNNATLAQRFNVSGITLAPFDETQPRDLRRTTVEGTAPTAEQVSAEQA